MTARSYLLVALLLSATLLGSTASTAAPSHATTTLGSEAKASPDNEAVVPFHLSPLHSKPPLEWSVKDVEYWMNHTIGYAEYAGYIRANLIDGVTLLEMEPADFESYLPIESPLHVVKIAAHIKLLKGMCKCVDAEAEGGAASGKAVTDFWSYMRAHSVRTWVWGTTVLFFPRWAMAGTYLFDHELYMDVVGDAAPVLSVAELEAAQAKDRDFFAKASRAGRRVVNTAKAGVYWASFAVAPDIYMAYQAARLTPRNYILMPCFMMHFLAQAFSECSLLITIYRGTAFKPGTPLLEKVWNIFSYTLFAPVLGVVVGYVFPTFLQYITVAVIIAHSALMVVGIFILVMRDGLSAAAVGPEDPRFKQHPEEQDRQEGQDAEETKKAEEGVSAQQEGSNEEEID